MDWTEKYRPQSLDGIIGNPSAVNALRSWARQWESGVPEIKAVVLQGSPGIGKTTSAIALAREMGWGVVEMNASDQRTASMIEQIAIRGAVNETFSDSGEFLRSSEGDRKLIILDEADNFFGSADRGASTAVTKLLTMTSQPVILIVNDLYGLTSKIPAVKDKTLQITFKKPQAGTMAKAIQRIADSEGVDIDPLALEMIVENAAGDMRAAVRNFEALALGQDRVTVDMAEGISSRDTSSDTFELIGAIFRSHDPAKARRVAAESDLEPRDIMAWVDENMPTEMTDVGDLVRGYERLSRSDIFLSRVSRRQYYGFWSYARDLMTFGVCASKQNRSRPGTRMNFPGVIRKMKSSKNARAIRYSVCLKLAEHLHTTSRRVQNDVLPYVKALMEKDRELALVITEAVDLEPAELGFLINKKADSKAVKSIYADIEDAESKRIVEGLKNHEVSAPSFVPPVKQTVKETPPEDPPEEPKPQRQQPKGQMSLFDF